MKDLMLENRTDLRYYAGRNNLACTIFVPFECLNNCPFCTSKQMYKGYQYSYEYFGKMVDWIHIANESSYISEFVLSGGEPLYNLEMTRALVKEMNKPVYINTTFPKIKGKLTETLNFLAAGDKIAGVNISRHIGLPYAAETVSDDIVKEINNYVRINCVVTNKTLDIKDKVLEFIDFWSDKHRMVNFRADYRNVTPDTLKNVDDFSRFMLENFKFEYSNSCLVCNSEFYSDEKEKLICYHRGLEDSCVTYGNRCYVNDVIVDIYGNVHRDWNMLRHEDFEKWLRRDACNVMSAEQKEQEIINLYGRC